MENSDQKLYDFLSGRLSEVEMTEVREWIEADEENLRHFQQYKADFLQMRWGMRASLVSGKVEEIQRRIVERRRFRLFRNLAAGVAIVCGIGGGLFFYWQPEADVQSAGVVEERIQPGRPQAVLVLASGKEVRLDSVSQEFRESNGASIQVTADGRLSYTLPDSVRPAADVYNRIIIPRGGEYMLQLADGTKVWLNAATEFRYPVSFLDGVRKVFLNGEAYFEVAKDVKRPFVVMADEVAVQVYGTKFDVNNYTAGKVSAVLVEGSVGMVSGGKEVKLIPGEMGQAVGEGITVSEVDVSAYIAWKNGDFVFNALPLEEIMDELVRWYDVEVFYHRPEARKVRLSGDMKRYKDVESLLYYFERISDLRFTIRGRTVVVE